MEPLSAGRIEEMDMEYERCAENKVCRVLLRSWKGWCDFDSGGNQYSLVVFSHSASPFLFQLLYLLFRTMDGHVSPNFIM